VRFVTRLLAIACLAAAALVPAATAADRMWVGFHDDPELRFDGTRYAAMDLAHGGAHHPLGDAKVGERRPEAAGASSQHA
jgi:hypothetical protein